MTTSVPASVIAAFPNPITWTIDEMRGLVGDAATAGAEAIFGGLVAWVLDAVEWVVGGVFGFFLAAPDPNVAAPWFVVGRGGDGGPYLLTATIAAALLVGFVLLGIIQGVLAGDPAAMVRHLALRTPLAVGAMVGLVAVTHALVGLTDALSESVLEHFEADVAAFGTALGAVGAVNGPLAATFVVLLLGLAVVLVGLLVLAELVVRAALVYLIVALAPFAFAAQVWPALASMARRTLELLAAVIFSKVVMAVALAVSAAALAGVVDGGQPATALVAPEAAGDDPTGSAAGAVGLLLAGLAGFGVAAFSPLLVAKLLPLTEGAAVAQGVRGMPVRGATQAMSVTATSLSLWKGRGSVVSRVAPDAPRWVADSAGPAAAASDAGPSRAATRDVDDVGRRRAELGPGVRGALGPGRPSGGDREEGRGRG